MLTLSIDPGVGGAIGCHFKSNLSVVKMGENVNLVAEQIAAMIAESQEEQRVAFVEKVNAFPGQGVCSVWTFSKNYGNIEGILACHKFQIIDVSPQKWMKALGVGKKKDFATRTLWKRHLQAHAMRLYPNLKFTLQEADAVLIMHYGLTHVKINQNSACID